jgi:hypothetical protein
MPRIRRLFSSLASSYFYYKTSSHLTGRGEGVSLTREMRAARRPYALRPFRGFCECSVVVGGVKWV